MKTKLLAPLSLLIFVSATSIAQTASQARPAAPAKLPSVQEVLAKYTKAIGGREAHEKIKSWHMNGAVEFAPMGVKGTFESISAAPDRSLMKMNLTGLGEFIEGYDGTVAWGVNAIQGSRVKSGEELAQLKLSGNFYREINLDKLYSRITVTGIEKINGQDAYVLVF
ncbi:MAG: hypothetical protein LC730_01590, partial [Acidobacteria bacterium]|nr:hypothetical protein [Acidobacteriota bacterium]